MKEEELNKLENIDTDDICDVLLKVEKSFKFKFESYELKDVSTFGELCDIIVRKIELEESDDCTTQQAFYKLREAILTSLQIDKSEFHSKINLALLFPKHIRRQKIKQVERALGFSLKVLRPKHSVTGFFSILFIISLFTFFVSWKFALLGIATSIFGKIIADIFGIEFKVNNISELVNKMSRENYINSRRNNKTINRNEVVKKVQELFSHDLELDPQFLSRESIFN